MPVKILRFFLTFIVCCLIYTINASSQECGDVALADARKFYEIGQFDRVFSTLEPCIDNNGLNDKQKVQAYRYLAMSFLALDSNDIALASVGKLLKIEPNFEPDLFDPVRFIELVTLIKQNSKRVLVTSVSKKAEDLLAAPATVMVITREQILRRGYLDLEAVLSDLPGFAISRTFGATYSNIYTRGYRSNNTDRTMVLVDGVEENDLWTNIAYFGRQYPLSNVKRIEVVYGPASTMYGANAFLGVINIITKEPDEYIGDNASLGVSAHANYGSWNTRYADVTLSGKTSGMALSLTGRVFRSEEMDLSRFPDYDYSPSFYDNFDYQSALSITSNAASFVRTNNLTDNNPLYTIERNGSGDTTAVRLTQAGAEKARNFDKGALQENVNGNPVRYSNITDTYLLGAKMTISDFTLSFQTWRSETGGTTYFTDNNEAGAKNGSLWIPLQTAFYVKYEKQINDNLFISNLTQYRSHELDEDTKAVYLLNYSNGGRNFARLLADRAPVWITEYYYVLSRQLRNELKALFTLGPSFDIISGLEVRSSQIQGDYLISYAPPPVDSGTSSIGPGGDSFDQQDIGLYVQSTYRATDNIKIVLGGRYDQTRIRSVAQSAFNPRLAVVFTPGDFVFKGIYATAFKQPAIYQRYSTNTARQVTNPGLDNENVSNIEVSAGWKITDDIFAEASYYRASYDNVVGTVSVINPKTGSPTTKNDGVGSLRIQGIQASVTAQLTSHYSLYGNFTYTDPYNTEKGEVRVGDIPSVSFNVGADALFLDIIRVNIRANYIGERPTGVGTSVPANPFGTFSSVLLLNGTISVEKLVPGITGQLILNNITNLEYFDPGVRSADGGFYSARTPQREQNIMFRIMYDL
jgi:outer membrane receptor for ferrienterochelin and colicins